jgi:hypothetical protein
LKTQMNRVLANDRWINGSQADDNAPYDFRMLFKEAGHKARYHPPFRYFFKQIKHDDEGRYLSENLTKESY